MNSKNKTVHGTHCCSWHGCKYDEPGCTVMLGIEPGVKCETCYFEAEQAAQVLDQLLLDARSQGPVLEAVAAEFQEEFRMYLCDCHPAGLPVALKNALEKAVVNYCTQVSKVK